MILEAVGLNYTVQARKVAFSFRNPFSMLAQAGANSNWWTCPDDVRHWIQDTTEYFALPAFALGDHAQNLPPEHLLHDVG
jgi:hypothetical protein